MNQATLSPALQLLAALRETVAFAPFGATSGNLTLGKGSLGGKPVHVAIVENRIASGSLGVKECAKLAQLFRIVAAQRAPLILYLDSAGARVSEGLPALGAFRAMFAAGLSAAAAGAPLAAVLGSNCYGGASLLAHLARLRVFSSATQLAMSGPSMLAQAAGANALDDMFRALAQAAIGSAARCGLAAENVLYADPPQLAAALHAALATPTAGRALFLERHRLLGERLPRQPRASAPPAPLQRPEFDKLFPSGYEILDADGVLRGRAEYRGAAVEVLGVVGGRPLDARRAGQIADGAWHGSSAGEARPVLLLLDCHTHATTLDDERVALSEYLCNLGLALHGLQPRGVDAVVLDRAGGGVYLAFAAAARRVALLHGGEIQLLPGSAIASILGELADAPIEFEDYVKGGVAEEELRLGLLPA